MAFTVYWKSLLSTFSFAIPTTPIPYCYRLYFLFLFIYLSLSNLDPQCGVPPRSRVACSTDAASQEPPLHTIIFICHLKLWSAKVPLSWQLLSKLVLVPGPNPGHPYIRLCNPFSAITHPTKIFPPPCSTMTLKRPRWFGGCKSYAILRRLKSSTTFCVIFQNYLNISLQIYFFH